MEGSTKLFGPLELKMVNGRHSFEVPWERAEAIQSHLRRHGVETTVCLDDSYEKRAHLELWEEIAPQRLQELLDQWQGL